MNALTDDEAALLYTVQMHGSAAYPISKLSGNRWLIGPWRGWKGFPVCYKTKKAAVAQFEGWMSLALERFADMRRANPDVIITAVGVKGGAA